MACGPDIQELQKQFEVKNFGAMCSIMTSSAKQQFCWMELPTWHAPHGQTFQVTLLWESEKPQGYAWRAKSGSWLGLRFKRANDAGPKKTYGKLSLELLNTDAFHTKRFSWHDFVDLTFGGDEYGLNDNEGLRVKIADVFDASKGWLEAGVLRLKAKLELVTEGGAPEETVEANLQMGVLKNWAYMFQSGEGSDVVFKVKNEEIHAHSLVLKAQSKVFAAMLSSHMRESTEREIVIDDLDPSSVRATIGFLYSGEVDDEFLKSDDNALGLLETAHRYDISSLEGMCVQLLTLSV